MNIKTSISLIVVFLTGMFTGQVWSQQMTTQYEFNFDSEMVGVVPTSWLGTAVTSDAVPGSDGIILNTQAGETAILELPTVVSGTITIEADVRGISGADYTWDRVMEVFEGDVSGYFFQYHGNGGANGDIRSLRKSGLPNYVLTQDWNKITMMVSTIDQTIKILVNDIVWVEDIALTNTINTISKIAFQVPIDNVIISTSESDVVLEETDTYEFDFNSDTVGEIAEFWTGDAVVSDVIPGSDGNAVDTKPGQTAILVLPAPYASGLSIEADVRGELGPDYTWDKVLEVWEGETSAFNFQYHGNGGSNGDIRSLRRSGAPNVVLNQDWNHIKTNINMEAQTMSVLVNDVIWIQNVAFTNAIEAVTKIQFQLPIDNVKISPYSPDTKAPVSDVYQFDFENDQIGEKPTYWSGNALVSDSIPFNSGQGLFPKSGDIGIFDIQEPLSGGLIIIEADVLAVPGDYTWKRVIEVFDESGVSAYFLQYHGIGGSSGTVRTFRIPNVTSYVLKEDWNHVKMVIDTDLQTASIFVNNDLWVDKVALNNSISGLSSFRFQVPTDNITIKKVSIEGLSDREAAVAALPRTTDTEIVKATVLEWLLNNLSNAILVGDTDKSNLIGAEFDSLIVQPNPEGTFPENFFRPIPEYDTNPYVETIFPAFEKNKEESAVRSLGQALAPELIETAYAALHPQSPYKTDPTAIVRLMNVLNSAFGELENNNDFMVSFHLPFTYLLLKTSFPGAIPPIMAAEWEAKMAPIAERIFTTRSDTWTYVANGWYNADIRWALGLYTMGILFDNEDYINAALSGFDEGGLFKGALLPDGGFNYVGYQNETFTYHGENIMALSWFYTLTENEEIAEIIRDTKNYYPLSYRLEGVGEYYTAASWKQYWNMVSGNDAAYVVASLTGDDRNYNRGKDATGLLPALFYNPNLAEVEEADSTLVFDKNIQGPRGNFGQFAYAASARNVNDGIGLGKITFVGAMSLYDLDSIPSGLSADDVNKAESWPLNAALSIATSEVKHSLDPDSLFQRRNSHYLMGQDEKSSVIMHDDHASFATKYNISTKLYVPTKVYLDESYASKWAGSQQWVMTKSGIIGVIEISAKEDDEKYAIHALLKLVSGRRHWGVKKEVIDLGDGQYEFGDLVITVHETDYTKNRVDFAPTWDGDDSGKASYLILSDKSKEEENTLTSYSARTSKYVAVEIRKKDTESAIDFVRIKNKRKRYSGFEITEGDTKYILVQNTGKKKRAKFKASYKVEDGKKVTLSSAKHLDRPDVTSDQRSKNIRVKMKSGKNTAKINTTIPKNGHILITISNDEGDSFLASESRSIEKGEWEDLAGETNLLVRPNPVTSTFILDDIAVEGAILNVFNSVGQLVIQRKMDSNTPNINISDLKSGIYFLQLKQEEKTYTAKIIKH